MQPRRLILPLLVVAIAVSYVCIITAGTFTEWSTWTTTYDEEAEGFRAGHLYIPMQPTPALLAAPNPYADANISQWYWDASLYKGHYYWYWAPFPALVIWAAKTVFRIKSTVGDQFPLFVSYLIYLGAGAAFIHRMARRLCPAISTWLIALAVLVFAYANPTPYEIATPGGYCAAIAGGQAFMLLGLLFAFGAVWGAALGSPPRRRHLLGAGISWALAIACRVSIGPPVLFLGCVTLFAIPRDRATRWRRLARDAAYLLGPVAAGVAALLAYNKARFDQWFEFGLRYQLNNMPFRPKWPYLWLNLYSYLLRPMGTSCEFPYVFALWNIGPRGFPAGTRMPEGYWSPEPVAGLLPSAPWTVLSVLAVGLCVWAVAKRYRTERVFLPADQRGRVDLWCAASFIVMSTVPLLPVAAVPTATMRYAADISTGVVLLATWGAWTAHARLAGKRPIWRRSALVVGVALAVATVILGVLLGLQGYDGMFKVHNPTLYKVLVRSLSFCRR
jgi:hypothetical protein